MKYMIVKNHDTEKLESQVNSLVAKGWLPQGGITFQLITVKGALKGTVMQAMIKSENK